ncbi:MAG: hypothetical protein ACM33T_04385 [Solirubrobacterales bacterium]
MSGTYRFSWLRPSGWTRLGAALGVMALFTTPMLWAVGTFGHDDQAIPHAIVFGLAGLWLFLAAGLMAGWAVRGFLVRVKGGDEDADEAPHGAASHAPAASRPPVRSGAH